MVRRLYPFEPERARCRRVAAWAWLIARHEKLDAAVIPILERAAVSNQESGAALSRGTTQNPFAEMDASRPDPAGRPTALDAPRLLQVLKAACIFDECLEALPYESRPLAELLEDAVSLSPGPSWPPLLDVFRRPLRFEERVFEEALARVPVNPEVVALVAQVAADPNSELIDLERLAGRDPALATALLQSANSARHTLRHPLSTLTQAINHLGLEQSRQVLTAAALRRAFRAPAAWPLWTHSVETASLAAAIARRVSNVEPSEAFLAGLLHDFGRLLLLASLAPALDSYPGLLERGCPPVAAELALCGIDHAEIGARVLERWRIAEPVREAVRQHHRPQQGGVALGALLQLCEEIGGSGEDLPGVPRLRDSLRTLRLPAGILAGRPSAPPDPLMALREES